MARRQEGLNPPDACGCSDVRWLWLESCESKIIAEKRGSCGSFGDCREHGSAWLPRVRASVEAVPYETCPLVPGLFLLSHPGINKRTEVHSNNASVKHGSSSDRAGSGQTCQLKAISNTSFYGRSQILGSCFLLGMEEQSSFSKKHF